MPDQITGVSSEKTAQRSATMDVSVQGLACVERSAIPCVRCTRPCE